LVVKKSPRRKYDSSRRKEQARRTRLHITEAARQLFMERSYAGATIEAIAEKAGVAKETVYAIFGSKRSILAFLLDISVGGDDRPVHLLDRPEQQAVLRDTDQRRQVENFAKGITEILQRGAPVIEIMHHAAKSEPEVAEQLTAIYKRRLGNMVRFVHSLAANGPLRDGLDEASAAETTWALTSPNLFLLFIRERSWSKEQYSRWLADILGRALLP
jgi:AcrR family transcriptional regulator